MSLSLPLHIYMYGTPARWIFMSLSKMRDRSRGFTEAMKKYTPFNNWDPYAIFIILYVHCQLFDLAQQDQKQQKYLCVLHACSLVSAYTSILYWSQSPPASNIQATERSGKCLFSQWGRGTKAKRIQNDVTYLTYLTYSKASCHQPPTDLLHQSYPDGSVKIYCASCKCEYNTINIYMVIMALNCCALLTQIQSGSHICHIVYNRD